MNKIALTVFLILPLSLLLSNVFKTSPALNPKTLAFHQQNFHQQKMPGEMIYKKYCISCHQADGGGVPNMAPPLQQTSYVLGEKETLIKIDLNGLKNVDINEETYNNPMPALGSVLKDQQIADVLTYVRNSFGNKAAAITAVDVKKTRADVKNKKE
jgi:mono/diheme cytochrome c family protein